MLGGLNHFRRENAGGAVKSWESFVKLSHLSADSRLSFNDIDFIARIGNIERGLNSGDTSADDERSFGNGAFTRLQRGVEADLCNGGAGKNNCLFGGLLFVLMNPRALLTDVCNLNHVRIKANRRGSFSECCFVHSRRARTDYNARQFMLCDCVFNKKLARFRTHILVILRKNNAGFFFNFFNNFFNVNRGGDIASAPTNENSYSLQS